MTKNTCELIRRDLDELMLDETCSTAALEHLRECGACREFHEKQTKLRQIVGSLGTVAAPADFDFRLRARLARESSDGPRLSFVAWPFSFPNRGFVAAATLLVFATGVFLVGVVVNHRIESDRMAKEMATSQRDETPKPTEVVKPNPPQPTKEEPVVEFASNKSPQKNRTERPRQMTARNTPRLATVDSTSIRADVIKGAEPLASSVAFQIDTSSVQYFKFSVDDGRGNAKTISVPTISFGSQRLMQNANQYAPKKVW
jgi:hypothetical protein